MGGSTSGPANVESLTIVGHLTRVSLAESLAPITAAIDGGTGQAMLVDCRAMTGYDADARSLFVEWNSAHRSRLQRVAVVTENRVWWMVIAAMALASRQAMKAFSDLDEARTWAQVGK